MLRSRIPRNTQNFTPDFAIDFSRASEIASPQDVAFDTQPIPAVPAAVNEGQLEAERLEAERLEAERCGR